MQDGKALQSGTSHFLGQNFAKAFDVQFTTDKGNLEYVWGTSWGVSTRMMGALVMAHSDDQGLVLPPKLAPIHVVIVPITRQPEDLDRVMEKIDPIIKELRGKDISVKLDDRDTYKPGWKFAEYEMKGVPVRIAVGPRDLENNTLEIARRDTLEKEVISFDNAVDHITNLLEDIQKNIYQKAFKFREENTRKADTWEEFTKILDEDGGFILAHWDGTNETEDKIKSETKATIRLVPFEKDGEEGTCVYSGNPSKGRVVFAKAY
jgi:prolyl-tRNA synthetase